MSDKEREKLIAEYERVKRSDPKRAKRIVALLDKEDLRRHA